MAHWLTKSAGSSLLLALLLAATSADARMWTSGKFMLEAELVEVKDGKAVLKRPDGSLVEIEVAKLSVADQRFLRMAMMPVRPNPNPNPNPNVPPPVDPQPAPNAAANLTQPPKVDSADFQAAIDAYWAAQKEHNLAEAERQLEAARELKLEAADAAVLARLEAHSQAMQQFWTTFQKNAARAVAGGELQVGSELVVIVESEGGRLVVRARGSNCRFAISNTQAIPAKLAAAFVGGNKPGGIVTLFRALGSDATDPDRWKAAAGVAPGANIGEFGGDPRPAALPKPAKKLPLPNAADREAAKKQLTELFAKDIAAAKNPPQKFELAKKWFELAHETYPQEPATCFVMASEASDMAAAIGNVVGGYELAEWLIDRYEIGDPLKVRVSYFLKTAKNATEAQQTVAAVKWGLELADAAAAGGKFDQVDPIIQAAQAAARATKNKEVLQAVVDKKKLLDEAHAAEGEMAAVRQTLAASPDDGAANHKLGLYLAGVRRSWKDALPHLAKSNDAAVAAAAKLDLTNPTDGTKQMEAGDGWWNLSEATKTGSAHEAYLARAVSWYEQAAPKLAGLAKIKVEKRLMPKP